MFSGICRLLIVCTAVLFLAACRQETLYTNLAERDANEITAVLLRAGIPATRAKNIDGKYDVSLGDSRYLAEAVTLLSDRGLPRKEFDDFGKVFKGDALVSTPTEIKARYVYALTQQLERTLSEIGGVITARVQVVMPESDPISRQRTPAGASVVITHDPELSPSALIPKVKQIVASSVDGLTYDAVSVTLFVKPVPRAEAAAQQAKAAAGIASSAAASKRAPSKAVLVVGALVVAWLWLLLSKRTPRKSKKALLKKPNRRGGLRVR